MSSVRNDNNINSNSNRPDSNNINSSDRLLEKKQTTNKSFATPNRRILLLHARTHTHKTFFAMK